MSMVRMAAGALVAWSALAAGIVPGDARRGEQLFQSEQCVQCHSVNGRGGATAPDLAKRMDRDYTPTVMASLMWNHAPDMWAAMEKRGLARPALTPEQSADLFAYFVSARYFEKRGDAGRGKQAFAAKHCADCHGIIERPLRGRPAGGQVGVAGGPRRAGAADVEPRGPNEAGLRAKEAGMGAAFGAGAGRYPGLSAEPAGNPRVERELPVSAIRFGGGAVRLQRLRRVPYRQERPRNQAAQPDSHRDRGRHVEPPAERGQPAAHVLPGGDAASF